MVMTEFLCVYCEKKIPEKEIHVCYNCSRIFCEQHHVPTTHNCKKIGTPDKTLPKATKKQEIIASLIIAGIIIAGVFGFVFGISALLGGLPEEGSNERSVLFALIVIPIIATVYVLPKLFGRMWNVRI